MDNSAYQQHHFFNNSNNSFYNPEVFGNGNWSNNYYTNSVNFSEKQNCCSNLHEDVCRNNLTKNSYFDSESLIQARTSDDIYANKFNSNGYDYLLQQSSKKQWSDLDTQTKAAAAASWGIMFPMSISNNSNRSPWTYDVNIDNRDNQFRLLQNKSLESNENIHQINQNMSQLTLSSQDRYGENENTKKTWALVVGKSGNKSIGSNHISRNIISSTPKTIQQTLINQNKINHNSIDIDVNPKNAKFFVIKSYSEDDVYRSIKYQIWCSTETGNRRLDTAYSACSAGDNSGGGGGGIVIPIYLFFSVNGSGHFCGVAQMMSAVDYRTRAGVWAQGKWKGQFRVRWVLVKDVPNSQLRHIRIETNENKPVTNSRDVTEIPLDKGRQVMKIMANYRATSSIYDDFDHYEQRELSELNS